MAPRAAAMVPAFRSIALLFGASADKPPTKPNCTVAAVAKVTAATRIPSDATLSSSSRTMLAAN